MFLQFYSVNPFTRLKLREEKAQQHMSASPKQEPSLILELE